MGINDVKRKENPFQILEVEMSLMEERVAKMESHVAIVLEKSKTLNKRLDEQRSEIKVLRTARHEHAGILHNHMGVLEGLKGAVDKLIYMINQQTSKTQENTSEIRDFKVMASTAISSFKIGSTILMAMGSGFGGFLVFIGGKVLHWW